MFDIILSHDILSIKKKRKRLHNRCIKRKAKRSVLKSATVNTVVYLLETKFQATL
ncbi:hypothetical protein [Pilibacter termitis]|uniref:hypothetical protein n=1 Tax=Pilibacter termitis TaxID=263852 RepID=UPI0013564933|nr:hypothetical protein [Pilibacter termitis]